MTVVACKPKPDKFDLGDLPKKIEGGDITIPQFQRQYVWNLEDCAKLLDSVFKGYPIGTVTLWMTQERLRQVKKKEMDITGAYPIGYLTSNYIFLGPVKRVLSYEGECPIGIDYELRHPIPADVYEYARGA